MRREELLWLAVVAEEESYTSIGRLFDGAPYDFFAAHEFYAIAKEFMGGSMVVRDLVIKRREAGEELADEYCANWLLWTVFIELGVSTIDA